MWLKFNLVLFGLVMLMYLIFISIFVKLSVCVYNEQCFVLFLHIHLIEEFTTVFPR